MNITDSNIYELEYRNRTNKKPMTNLLNIIQMEKDPEYFMLKDKDWKIYKKELPDKVQDEYRMWGYPKITQRNILQRDVNDELKNGIPCILFRGKPVFSDVYKDKVNEKYAKKWFEDWHWEKKANGSIEIRMPNTKTQGHIIKFRKISDARVNLLIDWFICAMDQIQRDNGGFNHE